MNEPSTDLLISDRLEGIEKCLQRLTELIQERTVQEKRTAEDSSDDRADWVDSSAFCRIAGIKNPNSLSYYMAKGIFTNKSIRNIGTVKKPRYRFHRRVAVDEFLNRSQLRLP